ncbi:hypothetical protein Q0590_36520 [Rhodocytophaga aerolata]|uniref:Uncharacterized protein n=1 Tax=Rhodocytophaga aerolata TaxID=455078 RepID=A0ABT8RI97_9BACT|nr:hypothetical protein [Rhodocytophaga aerolata]MDO1451832.1 hypothetical protein [Rhodocytophaga aerolata]
MLTENIALSPQYENHQKQFDYIFQKAHLIHTTSQEVSPKYRLDIHHYHHGYLTSEKSGYSISCQQLILRNQVGESVFEYKNRFGYVFYHYLQHSNTNEYLLCGNDLHEYVVYNITRNQVHQYASPGLLQPEKRTSHYWYIKELLYSPTADLIAVNGQDMMNCPAVTVLELDAPDVVPLKMLNLGLYLGQHYEEGYFCRALAWTADSGLQLWVGEEVSQTVILPVRQIRELLQNQENSTGL